jgi:hypothetical protein
VRILVRDCSSWRSLHIENEVQPTLLSVEVYLEDGRQSARGWWFRGRIPVASGARNVGWLVRSSLAFDLIVFNRSYGAGKRNELTQS